VDAPALLTVGLELERAAVLEVVGADADSLPGAERQP
jgi:hypothetical protein